MIFERVHRISETELTAVGDETHIILVSQLKWFALRVIPPLVEGRHGVFWENPSAFRAQFWNWMGTCDVLHPILLVSAMPGRTVVTILVCHRVCMLVSQGQKHDKVDLGNLHQLPIN